jgi:nitrogen regulatory protein P-II 1
MKRVEAVIRPTRVGRVCAALEKVGHTDFMISQIENHGRQIDIRYLSRGKTYNVDLMSRARVEVIVKDTEVDEIVKTISGAVFTGEIGDGEIFIHAMEGAIRIGTGDYR